MNLSNAVPTDITTREDKVEFLSTCYVKDYPADKKVQRL